MKKLVVLSGAGVSAESGLKTFRDSGGLWEGFDVMEVASIDGWNQDPLKVLDFYNQRRKQAMNAKPNQAHELIARLEQYFDVAVITQNVDNLHEQAGSGKVIHLHGELFKCRSTVDETLIYEMTDWQLNEGDLCEKGSQLRPHIVWFGEAVPMMDQAIVEVAQAEICIVIGTSLQVYPAAGLVNYINDGVPVYIIDPNMPPLPEKASWHQIEQGAGAGMEQIFNQLTSS